MLLIDVRDHKTPLTLLLPRRDNSRAMGSVAETGAQGSDNFDGPTAGAELRNLVLLFPTGGRYFDRSKWLREGRTSGELVSRMVNAGDNERRWG